MVLNKQIKQKEYGIVYCVYTLVAMAAQSRRKLSYRPQCNVSLNNQAKSIFLFIF